MIRKRLVASAALLVALVSGVMAAVAAGSHEKNTIRELLDAEPSRRLVTLEGTITTVAPNRLILDDGTGTIRLTTCPTWVRPLAFGKREIVRVVGHLAPSERWRNNNPAFIVYRLRGEYGTRLTLRYSDGVPIWHRYRDLPGRRLQWEIARETAIANWQQSHATSWY